MKAQVTSMEPFEAFYHPRFGAVILFRVTTEPSTRDYVYVRMPCAEQDAQVRVGGFLTGFRDGQDKARYGEL